ncbi:MAG TPA: hypothetical protein VIG88_08360 [Lysobacter sp.]
MRTLAFALAATALLAACSERQPTAETPMAEAPAKDAQASAAAPSERDAVDTAPAPAPDATPTPADTAPADADYLGRWTGVEGMYLVVAAKPGGGVTLEMQWDLDHKGTFDGAVTAEGLRFMRDGVAETAVRTDGDATGLKYLAGRKDCLTVKPGEGYCRD